MIVFPEREENKPLNRTAFGLDAPLSEVLSTVAKDILIRSPAHSIYRMDKFNEAERQESKFLSQEEYKNSEFFREGVTFPNGVKESVAKLTAERKDEERERQFIINRAPSGALTKSAIFGTQLAASMLDPLNVASAFIPVFGQARYASLINKVGSTKARAVRGASEGAVGAAVVEPLVLAASLQEQADYQMMDSLLNVSLSATFGAGLRVFGGKVLDVYKGYSPETREQAFRTAIAQALEGKTINTDPIFKMADNTFTDPLTGKIVSKRARREALDDIRALVDEGNNSDLDILTRLNEAMDTEPKLRSQLQKDILEKLESSEELQSLRHTLSKRPNKRTEAENRVIGTFKRDDDFGVQKDSLKEKIRVVDEKISKQEKKKTLKESTAKTKRENLVKLKQQKEELEAELRGLEPETRERYNNEAELKRDIERNESPESSHIYDKKGAEELDKARNIPERAIDKDLSEVDIEIQALHKAGKLTDEQMKAYKEFDKQTKDMEGMTDIAHSLAVCEK